MTKKLQPDEAKQRMREYLKEKGIPNRTAEVTCGYKRGYLSAGGVVGSDKLASFLFAYPDCDLYYIITGNHIGDPRVKAIKELLQTYISNAKENENIIKALNTLVTNMVTNK